MVKDKDWALDKRRKKATIDEARRGDEEVADARSIEYLEKV